MLSRFLELQGLRMKWGHKLRKPEENEQFQLVLWLEQNNYKYFAIPNSTWTKSILQRVRNTLMGVVSGPPDMCILLKRGALVFIELKRPRKTLKNGSLGSSPSAISDEQKEWIKNLASIDNVEAQIAYGWENAKEIIESLEG